MSGSEIQSASKSKNCISCTPVAAPLLWEDKLGGRSCFPDPLNSVLEFFLGMPLDGSIFPCNSAERQAGKGSLKGKND